MRKAAASCHTAHGTQDAEAKRYRCAITSCHGETEGLAGLDAPFIVNLSLSSHAVVSAESIRQNLQLNEDPSFEDVSEPPEGRLLS